MISQAQKIGLCLLAVGSVAGVSVGAVAVKENNQKALTGEATSHTVRVFAVLKGDWSSQKMYIHYLGGGHTGTTWTTCPEMTLMLNDFWSGLFYYDLPYNDYTTCAFKKVTGNVDKNSDQSEDVTIANGYNFSAGTYKAFWVQPWAADTSKRTVSVGDISISSLQAAAVLSSTHYRTCTSDYASGYFAYPQINTMIITKSTIDRTTSVNDLNSSGTSVTTTIDNKLTTMERLYNANK